MICQSKRKSKIKGNGWHMYNMTFPLFWSSYFPLSFQHGEYCDTISVIALSTRSTKKKIKPAKPFLWSKVQENIKPYGREAVQYGGNLMNQKIVYGWEEEFRCRSAADRPNTPSGCPPLGLLPGWKTSRFRIGEIKGIGLAKLCLKSTTVVNRRDTNLMWFWLCIVVNIWK